MVRSTCLPPRFDNRGYVPGPGYSEQTYHYISQRALDLHPVYSLHNVT